MEFGNAISDPLVDPHCARNSAMPVVLHTRVVSGQGGGPEKTILNSPRFLEGLGYRARCAYMHPPNDPGFALLKKRADRSMANLISIDDRGLRDLSVFRKLLKLCREEQVAIWHAHDYKSNFIGLMLRRFWPMKLVTTVHGWVKFTKRTPFYYWIDRRCLRKYDRILCVSDDLLKSCLRLGIPESRCRLIYNGIDTTQYARTLSTSAAKARLGIDPHRLVIGAVGRLSPEKGFDLLIQSVAQILNAGHNVHLVIAGEGDHRPRLQQLIASQPDPTRFQLLGHREDTTEIYQAMDVFALSSLREGLPNVLLEAMALNVPVVATRIAAVPRVVTHEHNGLLVEPGNVGELTTALQTLLANVSQRTAYAQAGRHTIETSFSFERRMQKIAAIYDELLGRTSAIAK